MDSFAHDDFSHLHGAHHCRGEVGDMHGQHCFFAFGDIFMM